MTAEQARLSLEIQKDLHCRDYTADYLAALVLREPQEAPGGNSPESWGFAPIEARAEALEATVSYFEAWQNGFRGTK